MTNEELEKANKLEKQIHELDLFLMVARKVWKGSLVIKKHAPKLFFKAHGYGCFESQEFELNTELKNTVIKVLEDKLEELKKEFEDIGKEAENDV